MAQLKVLQGGLAWQTAQQVLTAGARTGEAVARGDGG